MHLGSDLRYALRTVRRNPGFSLVAIATLAFGIGANTAIFSVFDGILLRPLGYGDENRLVAIHEVVPRFIQTAPKIPVNAMHFLEWRKSVKAFEQLAMIGGVSVNLTGSGEPERLAAARVSASLFPMLHARMRLGRAFLEEEDQPGRDGVVVLSNELWQRRFAADAHIIGRKILLDGHPYQVIGVLSSDFHFPKLSQLYAMTIAEERPELWKPFAVDPDELEPLGDFNFACIGRLRRGVSLQHALAELNAVQARLASQAPEKLELFAALVPLQDQITNRSRTGLTLVLGAVGAVLLIGSLNIANLLLARAISGRRELAIRSAIGASTWRLVRQTLVESLLLAGIGGAAGVMLAFGALHVILTRAPVDLPRLDEVHLDMRVLLFTAAISIFAGFLFGILPAWRLSRTDPQDAMRAAMRGAADLRGSGRLRAILVGVEVGLSTLCLMAGGLLLHSFANLLDVDRGFAVQRVVTVNLNLPGNRYPDPTIVRFTHSLLDSVRVLPGVVSAGVSDMLPLGGEGHNNLITIEGTDVPFMDRPGADIRRVNSEYFATMGIALRQGRIFEETDGDHKLALVSALTAERLWPGENPPGKRFKIGDPDGPFVEVAGVVGDVKGVALDRAPSLTVYVPYWQGERRGLSLAVKTAIDPAAISSSIRRAIHRLDPELPVPRFQTMQEIVDESVAQRRFQMNLVLLFGIAALALASLGIYGVVSYSVVMRTNEIGIRMALGARTAEILCMVLTQAMAPVATGLGCGLVASLAAGRLLTGLLYGVRTTDAATIGGVVVTLLAVALFAGLIPARRATRVDPMASLRYD